MFTLSIKLGWALDLTCCPCNLLAGLLWTESIISTDSWRKHYNALWGGQGVLITRRYFYIDSRGFLEYLSITRSSPITKLALGCCILCGRENFRERINHITLFTVTSPRDTCSCCFMHLSVMSHSMHIHSYLSRHYSFPSTAQNPLRIGSFSCSVGHMLDNLRLTVTLLSSLSN